MVSVLTGAGFSKPFGYLLASELWDQVFSHPEVGKWEELLDLLTEEKSVEKALDEADALYDLEVTGSLRMAIIDSFREMEQAVAKRANSADWKCKCFYTQLLLEQVYCANGHSNCKTLLFTLNLDHLIEKRIQKIRPKPRIDRAQPSWSVGPDNDQLASLGRHISYLKLHGDIDPENIGAQDALFGTDKSRQRANNPFIDWQWRVLEQVLAQPEHRMIVIGYGFQERDLNVVLDKHVQEHGLRLFIWNTEQPHDLFTKAEIAGLNSIRSGCRGYCSQPMTDFLPDELNPSLFPFPESLRLFIQSDSRA